MLLQRRAFAAAMALWPAVGVALASDDAIQVGRNVRVSRAREGIAHNEVLLAADPVDPGRLLGCSMAFDPQRNKVYTIVYASSDGGASWTPTLETSDLEFSGDPACALGKDRRAYYMALGWKEGGKVVDPIYRSGDSGATWSQPLLLHSFHGLDREYLSVDNTGGKFDGRVYAHATGWARPLEGKRQTADISLFVSRDGGASFLGPLKRTSVGKRYVLGVGNSVVLSDGTLVMIFGEVNKYWDEEGDEGDVPASTAEKANGTLEIVTSTDGGESLETASTVSDFHMLWPPFSTSMIASLAADPGSAAFKDRLYAVWPDQRSGRQEILLAHSEDKGKSWSKPIVVNDDAPGATPARDHLMPTAAVNKEGVVAVAWYDRRDNPDDLGWFVRLRASRDGGETFLPSVRVSEAPAAYGASEQWTVQGNASGGGKKPPDAGPDAKAPGRPIAVTLSLNPFQFNGGHTGGMATTADGRFHPFWVDNRTGIAQLWTAAVTVPGAAVKNGSPELAALDDVSDAVELKILSTDYDRKTNRLAIRVKLQNTSSQAVAGPLKLRLIDLSSQLGRARAENADNGISGPGAVWTIREAAGGAALAPGAESSVQELAFRISDLRPFRDEKSIRYLFASFQARVLGKRVPAAKETPKS
ncbi:MAG TPA: sialidase family protein [Thermoanaerobaculia bacterium]|nr:sialidase family protein [Thermoanaerobaculia bacterium]